MLVELPNGDECEWDSEESCPEGLLLGYDVTFPYAWGGGCPAEVFSENSINTEKLEQLNGAINRAIRYLLSGKRFNAAFVKAHKPLTNLCDVLARSSTIQGDEVERDSYADLVAFRNYLSAIVSQSPTYIGITRGEDIGAGPGMTSAYEFHWDKEPAKAARLFNRCIASDLRALRAREYTNRRA